MAFAAAGKASGSAGCNSDTWTYQADRGRLRITRVAATRRTCADAGVMEQEQAFFKALESVATTWMMEADWLRLRTAEGASFLLVLQRAVGLQNRGDHRDLSSLLPFKCAVRRRGQPRG